MKRTILLAMVILSGCATYSGIIPEGKESYLIIATSGRYAYLSPVDLKISAHKQASEFCKGLNKQPETISEKMAAAGMLSDYSEYDLKFKCVASADAAAEGAEASGHPGTSSRGTEGPSNNAEPR